MTTICQRHNNDFPPPHLCADDAEVVLVHNRYGYVHTYIYICTWRVSGAGQGTPEKTDRCEDRVNKQGKPIDRDN